MYVNKCFCCTGVPERLNQQLHIDRHGPITITMRYSSESRMFCYELFLFSVTYSIPKLVGLYLEEIHGKGILNFSRNESGFTEAATLF